jgi:uncharacterized membrane protein YphA (DoxX/SURF4 family)
VTRRTVAEEFASLSPSYNLRRAGETVRARLPAVIRIFLGLLWFANVDWKVPPDFGRDGGSGLYRFVTDGIEHPVLPPYSYLLEHLIRPNIEIFGWMVVVVEATLATLLIVGAFTRVAVLLGIGQTLAITFSVMNAPGEWYWSYLMMIALHVAVFGMDGGSVWAVDSLLKKRGGGRAFEEAVYKGQIACAVALAGFALLLLTLQIDKPFATTSYPASGIGPVKGTLALGFIYVWAAVLTWYAAGGQWGSLTGWVFLTLAVLIIFFYRSPLNVLSAAPSNATIFAGAALFLIASREP